LDAEVGFELIGFGIDWLKEFGKGLEVVICPEVKVLSGRDEG
jgi:hypothetical protein